MLRLAVKIRIVAVGPGLEAAMHPQVLVRLAADFLLDGGVHAGCISQFVAGGEIFQCRVEVDVVAGTILPAEVTERHHRAPTALGNAGCGGDGARGDAEEGREDYALATVVLVRGVPDRAVLLEPFQQPAQVLGIEHGAVALCPGPGHDRIHQGVVMVPLHDIGIHDLGGQAAAHFQGAVVAAHQQDALAALQGAVQVFKAVDTGDVLEVGHVPEPAQPDLHHADAIGPERLSHQGLLLLFGKLREAAPDIHLGDMAALGDEAPGQVPQESAHAPLPADWQPGHQPHHREADPGGPPAGMPVVAVVEIPFLLTVFAFHDGWTTCRADVGGWKPAVYQGGFGAVSGTHGMIG